MPPRLASPQSTTAVETDHPLLSSSLTGVCHHSGTDTGLEIIRPLGLAGKRSPRPAPTPPHAGSQRPLASAKKTEEQPKDALHELCGLQLLNQESVVLDEEGTKPQPQKRGK